MQFRGQPVDVVGQLEDGLGGGDDGAAADQGVVFAFNEKWSPGQQ